MSPLHPVITRFAPTPSGELHVGHVLAARQARRMADVHGGSCLLRIEDIDTTRTRNPQFLIDMLEDLAWLGLSFDGEMMVQSRRMNVYKAALEQLRSLNLLYPCFCTRAEIRAEWEAMSRAPHGRGFVPYSGRCRNLPPEQVQELLAGGVPHAWRINMRRVQDLIGCPLWEDINFGVHRCIPTECEDAVLARKDTPTSYHLAVVVDDAAQGITLVTRGEDLLPCTSLHCALQHILGLPTPLYAHHLLLRDEHGLRLAKRDGARSIRSLRALGFSPSQIFAAIDLAIRNSGIVKFNKHPS